MNSNKVNDPPMAAGRRLLTFSETADRVKRKRTAIYGDIKKGEFPPPVKIGESSRWVESEIDQYIQDRILERDEGMAV